MINELSRKEIQILSCLNTFGELSRTELSRKLNIQSPSISKPADRLAVNRLIQIRQNPGIGNSHLLSITERGKQLSNLLFS